jgi:hypothetical protein
MRRIKLQTAPALCATRPWKAGECVQLNARLLILLFLIVMYSTAAMATTVVKMDLPSLVKTSDSIVEGVITGVNSKWDASQRMAFTEINVQVHDNLKGDRSHELTIRHLGGQIGAMHMEAVGQPKFQIGEAVIVFLKQMNNGTFYVNGLDQGKYTIDGSAATSNQSGLEVLEPASGRILTGATTKTTVDGLKARIRELVK